MSYLDRIAECNTHDLERFVPFVVAGVRVGWVRRNRLPALRQAAGCLVVANTGVTLDPNLTTFESRSMALAQVVEALTERGQLSGWRGEQYPVCAAWGQPPLLQLERAAVPWFGIQAHGVHVNGFVRRGDDLLMWIARRARDKPSYPGMLDNTVAGGQPIGISLLDNVIKECGEEAGIPAAVAARARAVGAITYCLENDSGIKPDCMFLFDLELSADFEPRCVDGEAEAFHLWPIERVAALVRDTREFKFNCNLVIVDFLARHGLLDHTAPDYLSVVRGLRAW